MKILSVEISNIGIIEHIIFEINKPLLIFFGEPRQGKTTILKSIILASGGSFPDDILRHGATEGFIEEVFSNGLIRREFYKAKDGATKARKIKCVIDGEIVDKPVEILKQFVNPFLLDQDFFVKKSGLEKQRYFAEILDVNIDETKKRIREVDDKAKNLRSEIKGYGEIDVTPVDKIDVEELKAQRHVILNKYQSILADIQIKNRDISEQNEKYDQNCTMVKENLSAQAAILLKIAELEAACEKLKKENNVLLYEREKLSKQDAIKYPSIPDTTDIDDQIAQAYAQEVRREQYIKNMMRVEERENKKKKLVALEQQKKDEEKSVLQELGKVAETSGIPGLKFDENAAATFENTALDMLSMSQMMRLSSLLSAKYPEGFGIELIDRGESLGKSIYGFIEKAKREDKAILATVVGEKPAQIPEDVGVWVVEKGNLK